MIFIVQKETIYITLLMLGICKEKIMYRIYCVLVSWYRKHHVLIPLQIAITYIYSAIFIILLCSVFEL